jgi:acetolactate synthase-1/2/3 large subunit
MRVADYIIRQLTLFGVQDIFLLPGGGAMYLNDAVANSEINSVCCLQEQSTGIAAESYGKYHPSGLGVAIVTSGPGSTNVITPVVGAWIESNAMLVISGQVKRADLNKSNLLRQSGVQEVNIVSMVRGVTKFVHMLEDPLIVREVLRSCILKAISGRKGPSWLDVPLDIQAFTLPADYPDIDFNIEDNLDEYLVNDELYNALELLEAAERPLLLVGQGLRGKGDYELIKNFAEKFEVPVLTTFPATDLFDYHHPLFVGRPGGVSVRSANFAVQNCDLLLSVGSSLNNVITAYNPQGFAASAKKILVDIDENELKKHKLKYVTYIKCDALTFLSSLVENNELHKKNQAGYKRKAWTDYCFWLKQKYSVEYKKFISPETMEISHYDLIESLSSSLEEGDKIATGSSGLGIEVFYAYFKNKKNQKICITSGMGSMGYGLPTAIGMAIACKGEKIYCLEGDGSLQMNIQELAMIKGLNLSILIIIINNGGYASIRNSQTTYFDKRFIGVGDESGLYLPNLEKISFGYEIPYKAVKELKFLKEAIRAYRNNLQGPSILEVFLDPNEKLFPKVQASIASDGKITSMPIEDMAPLLSLDELMQALKYTKLQKESYVARGLKFNQL